MTDNLDLGVENAVDTLVDDEFDVVDTLSFQATEDTDPVD